MFDGKVSIINIFSETLLCNFILGGFKPFFNLILESKKSQNYDISMEGENTSHLILPNFYSTLSWQWSIGLILHSRII